MTQNCIICVNLTYNMLSCQSSIHTLNDLTKELERKMVVIRKENWQKLEKISFKNVVGTLRTRIFHETKHEWFIVKNYRILDVFSTQAQNICKNRRIYKKFPLYLQSP